MIIIVRLDEVFDIFVSWNFAVISYVGHFKPLQSLKTSIYEPYDIENF
jgi:hypothetical protein